MILINNTTVELCTDSGVTLKPGSTYTCDEKVFDTINLHSNIGSCIITCEYANRSVKTFGIIDASVDKENNTIYITKRF